MSILLDFHTYEVMDGATIETVSSESTGHPAEHAISPLEPNFAWQANQANTQHVLTVDLGESRTCDGFSYIHHERDTTGPPVAHGITVTVQYSDDATTWNATELAYHSDGSLTPTDHVTEFIKLRYFIISSVPVAITARYWQFTFAELAGPFFYAPVDMRISMCWLFRLHQLDRGRSTPDNSSIVYPVGDLALPFGKTYRTGYSVNASIPFTGTWMVTNTEYDVLRSVMRECNGVYRPFLLRDWDNTRRLCQFTSDEIDEELLDLDLYRVTCQFVELPIVKKDKYH
ncbi:MAG: discoidin domain-containing protein [Patescibacteria group bacterium]|jgi:hypothetical protein